MFAFYMVCVLIWSSTFAGKCLTPRSDETWHVLKMSLPASAYFFQNRTAFSPFMCHQLSRKVLKTKQTILSSISRKIKKNPQNFEMIIFFSFFFFYFPVLSILLECLITSYVFCFPNLMVYIHTDLYLTSPCEVPIKVRNQACSVFHFLLKLRGFYDL